MDETKLSKRDSLPKMGRVNEMCREWLVREDGALAYRLQSQEINEHYTGNKSRNAQLREDFPCALDEQIREQEMAEQAAAVYQRMLAEQEEHDQEIAKELAKKLDTEERKVLLQDSHLVQQVFNDELPKIDCRSLIARPLSETTNLYANVSRRSSKPMPLPNDINAITADDLYTEPYRVYSNVDEHLEHINLSDVGVPIDEVEERRIQEQRDAELARQLQEMETSSEEFKLNRDRMLAIEAQDKELAKLLQERERAKIKRAKERARQKALAKKQSEQNAIQEIVTDDSYSNPIDLLHDESNYTQVINAKKNVAHLQEDCNYSSPFDAVPRNSYDSKQSPSKKGFNFANSHNSPNSRYKDKINEEGLPQLVRPNQLDLKSPLNASIKTKFKEQEANSNTSSPLQLKNIAMAIDPTYTRRNVQSPASCDTTSSSTLTSTLSSSPGILPSPDISEEGDLALPYMPIQGQKRTGSVDKKKRRAKDGCKQQ